MLCPTEFRRDELIKLKKSVLYNSPVFTPPAGSLIIYDPLFEIAAACRRWYSRRAPHKHGGTFLNCKSTFSGIIKITK